MSEVVLAKGEAAYEPVIDAFSSATHVSVVTFNVSEKRNRLAVISNCTFREVFNADHQTRPARARLMTQRRLPRGFAPRADFRIQLQIALIPYMISYIVEYQKPAMFAIHSGREPSLALQDLVTGSVTGQLSATVFRLDSAGNESFCSAGTTELGAATPPRPDTMYFVGSVAKVFTAVAAYHLANQGQFGAKGLDEVVHDHIDKWADILESRYSSLPNVSDFRLICKNGILPSATLRDAIGHKSGLGDNHQGLRDSADLVEGRKDPGFVRHYFKSGDRPREGTVYSSTMYTLLGMIMEAETGLDIEDIIDRQVVQRYGLTSTMVMQKFIDMPQETKSKVDLANLYSANMRSAGLSKYGSYDTVGGAANIFSSPRDLGNFFHAIVRDPVLDRMRDVSGHSAPNDFGHGLVLNRQYFESGSWVGHAGAGGHGAIAADIVLNPNTGETVVFTATNIMRVESRTLLKHLRMNCELYMSDDEAELIEVPLRSKIESVVEALGIPSDTRKATIDDFRRYNLPELQGYFKTFAEEQLVEFRQYRQDIQHNDDSPSGISQTLLSRTADKGSSVQR